MINKIKMINNFVAANKQQEILEKLFDLEMDLFYYFEEDDPLPKLIQERREQIEYDLKSFYNRELKAYDRGYPITQHQESPLTKLPFIEGKGMDKHNFKNKNIY
jgi:hypothetical protein